MKPLLMFALGGVFALQLTGCVSGADGGGRTRQGVKITPDGELLRVEVGGKLFTEYHYTNVLHPFFYPVLGPEGLAMTRKWPLESPPGEEHDHPHHKGLWYAHSSVNGMDFWSERTNAGAYNYKIVHQQFLKIESGANAGVIVSTDDWVDKAGRTVVSDVRTVTIYNEPDDARMMDFEVTLKAPDDKPVVFGDEKDGTIATRVPESMRLVHNKTEPGEGHIVMSTGARDKEAWGTRADWCDYYGPVEGKTAGVAIFDHPSNLRHPTWWHARDYGLMAANPFGIHDFEKKAKGTGDYTLPAGQSLTFKYRFYWHLGDEKEARVAEHYAEYAGGTAKP